MYSYSCNLMIYKVTNFSHILSVLISFKRNSHTHNSSRRVEILRKLGVSPQEQTKT